MKYLIQTTTYLTLTLTMSCISDALNSQSNFISSALMISYNNTHVFIYT